MEVTFAVEQIPRRTWMILAVVPVSGPVCQVQAAHERDRVVDHHDLLVMAVNEMLTRIEGHSHAGTGHQTIAIALTYLAIVSA